MFLKNQRSLLKIGDMGMSKHGSYNSKGYPTPFGNICYKAPELKKDDVNSLSCSPKVDVYSLGISIWEMIHKKLV